MNFASDNAAGVAPDILAAIARANDGAALAYGRDDWTKRVEQRFAELFEREVAVFLVPTGTAANALALAHLTPPWGAVLCHAEAHIATDECGAPEFFGGGIKLIGLPGEAGKIAPETLAGRARSRAVGRPASRQPRRAVAVAGHRGGNDLSRRRDPRRSPTSRMRRGLAVHVDGARLRGRARAHERVARGRDLAGRRRRALVRRHQGRRARRRGGGVLRSRARRRHVGAPQARRPSRVQAPLHRRAVRGLPGGRAAGSRSRGTPTRWPTGWPRSSAPPASRRSGRSRPTRCSSCCRARTDARLKAAGASYYEWTTDGLPPGRAVAPDERPGAAGDVVCHNSRGHRAVYFGRASRVMPRGGQSPAPFPAIVNKWCIRAESRYADLHGTDS